MKKKDERLHAQMVCPSCGETVDVDEKVLAAFKDEVRIQLESELIAKENKLQELLEKNRAEIRKEIENQSLVKMKQKDKLILDLKNQIQKVNQKIEASTVSAQSIGETQELAIEDFLSTEFKTDTVIPVPKGVKGADCVLVCEFKNQIIGRILIESKRVSSYSENWLDKLRENNLNLKTQCDAMILITSKMPSGITDKIIFKDGIWICEFNPETIKQLILILRFSMLKISEVVAANKSHDQQAIIDYIHSTEYKLLMQRVLRGFQNLGDSFQQEKKRMDEYYKIRHQALSDMLESTLQLTTSMRDRLPSIPQLEFIPQLNKAS